MGQYNKSQFKEGIETIPSILEWVEKQDVTQMTRFFVQAPNVPMYLFASGGASSALHYAALLYETNRGMAKPLNPLMMASVSDDTLKNSKIFIFSTSGGGVDARYVLNRALAVNPNGLAVLSRDNDEDNYLIKTFIKKTGSENWFQYRWPSYKGFVSPVSGIAVMSLFYRAFTGKNDISSKLKVDLNPRSCFSYSPRKEGKIPPLKDIKTFITLYGGWSEPVAYNFENTMIEGGLANVQLSNYRNYGHGRFIYLSNHFEDCAFVLFVTPREKEFVNDFIINATFYEYGQKEVFPPNLPIIIVETEHDSPLATIDLVIKTKVLLGEIAQAHGENPCNPQNKMNIPKGALINMGFKNLLEIGSIKGEVLQGTDGTLKGVNRKKQIKYDPKLSIGELAKKNGVKEPTIQKYIREHNIDRQRDAKMILYNRVWEEYIKDSERSKASIARALDISENTLKLYLEMKTPPIETAEGKVGRATESDTLSKLRNKLKGKAWDLNLKFKYGAVVKDSQETAIPEATELQESKPKETPTRKKKVPQEVRNKPNPSRGAVKGIIGAVIGDIVGSRFEFLRAKNLPIPKYKKLFATTCTFTDDSALTLAIADALLHKREFRDTIWEYGHRYPNAGFGSSFKNWLKGDKSVSNNSIGNGCGMRVSPIGFNAKTLDETLELAKESAIISHNSEEGIRGAQSIAAATFLAKQQIPKEEIKAYIEKQFGYNLDQTDEEIEAKVVKMTKKGEREFAENTCPLAIIAFLVTDDYESSIRKSISYSCDTDTVACMCGGISAAYYGVPQEIVREAADFLPQELLDIINEFDGLQLSNHRTTPSTYNRWGDILVYGSSDDQKGEVGALNVSRYFEGKPKVTDGLSGRAYAIPTVGKSLKEIKEAVNRFCDFAKGNQDKTFLITKIGCAEKVGYAPIDIAPMFISIADLPNVYLPKEFREVLLENEVQR